MLEYKEMWIALSVRRIIHYDIITELLLFLLLNNNCIIITLLIYIIILNNYRQTNYKNFIHLSGALINNDKQSPD